jgi:hypothetical protein
MDSIVHTQTDLEWDAYALDASTVVVNEMPRNRTSPSAKNANAAVPQFGDSVAKPQTGLQLWHHKSARKE